MKLRRALVPCLALVAACAALLATSTAHARDCSAASDCPLGFQCVPSASNGSPAGTCVSWSCQSDSDCGPGFRCYVDIDTECVVGPDGGQQCGPGSQCVPQWQAPCSTDSNCGPGFTCTPGGAVFNCGKDQDAAIPPYDTAMPIACADIPQPPDPCKLADSGPDSGCMFPVHSLCDAGSTCTELTWNSCQQQATGPCTVDSDCPSTWTCQCQANYGGPGGPEIPADASPAPVDAACMKRCVPPNSDLAFGGFNGGAEAPSTGSGPAGGPSTPDAGNAGVAANPASPSAGRGGHGSNGGCRMGAGNTAMNTPWGAILAICGAAWVRRRRRSA